MKSEHEIHNENHSDYSNGYRYQKIYGSEKEYILQYKPDLLILKGPKGKSPTYSVPTFKGNSFLNSFSRLQVTYFHLFRQS